MTASVGEQHHQIPLFDANPGIASTPLASAEHVPAINVPDQTPDLIVNPIVNQIDRQANTPEPRRSARVPQPSQARLQSMEYQRHEITERDEGQDWANDHRRPQALAAIDWSITDHEDFIVCLLTETKASHHIPRSYQHAIATDLDRWMVPMRAKMETLKVKHTWDLVQPPPGANIMGSMWIYDIKWDGEGN